MMRASRSRRLGPLGAASSAAALVVLPLLGLALGNFGHVHRGAADYRHWHPFAGAHTHAPAAGAVVEQLGVEQLGVGQVEQVPAAHAGHVSSIPPREASRHHEDHLHGRPHSHHEEPPPASPLHGDPSTASDPPRGAPIDAVADVATAAAAATVSEEGGALERDRLAASFPPADDDRRQEPSEESTLVAAAGLPLPVEPPSLAHSAPSPPSTHRQRDEREPRSVATQPSRPRGPPVRALAVA